ncbi:MAG: tRNA 2-thiouridine(34) synthase MnmA [Chloroflexi bacterium]|nr:tRNA 2-thiouridine(34) synthase MnmA [Chloroflexota bacterium]
MPSIVAVAMSGGVDSSVAAALLQEAGYTVHGVTMQLWREPSQEDASSPSDGAASAQAVCEHLGIPHHVVDLRQAFYEEVVQYFLREYARGRTPNPCLRCNRLIKFGALFEWARTWGAQYLATGHYARILDEGGCYALLCGRDVNKDQSYFLYTLKQEDLAHLLFPIGEWTKERVREYALERHLPVAERPESQDICFLPGGDYRRFIAQHAPEAVRPGPIYDAAGRLLGEHHGLPFYTVGQREGLGISAPKPFYVLALDVARNALIVGYAEELGQSALLAEEMTYVCGEAPPQGANVEAKIRYKSQRIPARVYDEGDGCARVYFERPLRDITPGQAVVLYKGERVLGGGIIARPLPADSELAAP